MGIFSFDFIDKNNQYIRTPDDIEIFSVSNGLTPAAPVYSIEKSLRLADPGPPHSMFLLASNGQTPDPKWETYAIPEGILLRIKQKGHDDRFLQIPTRKDTLTLQPM
jgi:hypothetical protein